MIGFFVGFTVGGMFGILLGCVLLANRVRLIALCLVTFNVCAADSVVERIAHVESGNDFQAIGDGGKSRGAWQLTEAAWLDVNSLRRAQLLPEFDWELAHDSEIAREYAVQYLGLLSRRLTTALRRAPSPAELYASYNLGFAGFQRRGFSLARCPIVTQRAAKNFPGEQQLKPGTQKLTEGRYDTSSSIIQ